jgi:hypothetical protein
VIEDPTRPSRVRSLPNPNHAVAHLNHLRVLVAQERPDGRAKRGVLEIEVGRLGQLGAVYEFDPEAHVVLSPKFQHRLNA